MISVCYIRQGLGQGKGGIREPIDIVVLPTGELTSNLVRVSSICQLIGIVL